MAISSPLLETSINGARGVLINITGCADLGMEEVEIAADLVREAVHPDANIIFGNAFDDTMEDEMQVTIIATNYDEGASGLPSGDKPFTKAAEKVDQLRQGEAAAAPAEPTVPAEDHTEEDQQWEDLFKIFNRPKGE